MPGHFGIGRHTADVHIIAATGMGNSTASGRTDGRDDECRRE
jgi:hypothetical protein